MRKKRKIGLWIFGSVFLSLLLVLGGALLHASWETEDGSAKQDASTVGTEQDLSTEDSNQDASGEGSDSDVTAKTKTKSKQASKQKSKDNRPLYKLRYQGNPYAEVNGNKPSFTKAELKKGRNAYTSFSDLDKQGRCQVAIGSLSVETMPRTEREDISSVHPSGWRSGQGWERCHLIGFQLCGENANPKNLITGSHYLNVTGMLPFENTVASYIRRTGNHVLYRVTPIYKGKEFIARGVEMEAQSVEDDGVSFHVYIFNVVPDCDVDYVNGYITGDGQKDGYTEKNQTQRTYVLNTNTKRFHYPSCHSAKQTLDKNKEEVKTTRKALIEQGYTPCGNCDP